MTSIRQIRKFARDVVRQFRPEQIILFGSYARGRVTTDSDVDLLVVMEHKGRDVDRAFAIRRSIARDFSLDLLVRKPAEIQRGLRQRDGFLREIFSGGRTLYARQSERMDRQS